VAGVASGSCSSSTVSVDSAGDSLSEDASISSKSSAPGIETSEKSNGSESSGSVDSVGSSGELKGSAPGISTSSNASVDSVCSSVPSEVSVLFVFSLSVAVTSADAEVVSSASTSDSPESSELVSSVSDFGCGGPFTEYFGMGECDWGFCGRLRVTCTGTAHPLFSPYLLRELVRRYGNQNRPSRTVRGYETLMPYTGSPVISSNVFRRSITLSISSDTGMNSYSQIVSRTFCSSPL